MGSGALFLAREEVRPVALAEFAKIEMLDCSDRIRTLLGAALDQLLYAKLHALELIKQADIPQTSITRACHNIPGSLVYWIVLSSIESQSVWG